MGVSKRGIGGSSGTRMRPDTDRLTDLECRNAEPGASIRKLFDGQGMYLAVKPNSSKLWRLKFSLADKEGLYSIGEYPEISLAAAREERTKARAWIREGKDPTKERQG